MLLGIAIIFDFRVSTFTLLHLAFGLFLFIVLIDQEDFAQKMVCEPITHNETHEGSHEDYDEIIEATDITQERHAVIGDALLLGCSRLQPHLYGKHGLLCVDVFSFVTIPVLTGNHIFVLHTRQRVRQLF